MRWAVVLLLSLSVLAQGQLTTQEKRGQQIFEHGISAFRTTIEASIAGDTRVPASVLPCASCHGHDGRGRPEGGTIPSNITWDALTKPYGLTHSNGRTHPAYNERSLRRAITMGMDPGGNPLNEAMPRFQLSMTDAMDLVAYVKELGRVVDPGLTDTTVQLGVIVSPPSRNASTNRIIRQALLHYFARVNGAGGVFGRRIELTFEDLPSDAAQRSGAVLESLHKAQVFAVVGADFTGSESELAEVMLNTGTPTIAALAPFPRTDSPLNRFVFYLDGGVKEETGALLRLATQRFPEALSRAAILSSNEEDSREAAKWLEAHLKNSEPGHLIATGVQAHSPELIFWLRPGAPLASFVTGRDRETTFLVPASVGGEASFALPNSRVFVALHTATPGQSAEPGPKSPDELNWERATASAELMTEAMTRTGRELTRAGLLDALEGFYNVQTSLAAPISFGPNRRVGTSAVRIMVFDSEARKLVPVQDGSM